MKELNAMKNKNILEVILKVIVAAIAAAPTAITTTSCMGHSPFRYELSEQTNKSRKCFEVCSFFRIFAEEI